MSQYNRLISVLDKFRKKYYLNQLLKGALMLLIGLSAIVLILSLSEYFLFFPPFVKVSLLILLTLSILFVFSVWIMKPILGIRGIGKTISREQAATLIGQFFPEVKDKLLNILQLQNHKNVGESEELVLAGIEQKSAQISVVPMLNAVNLKENKRFLPWLLPGIAIIALILLFWPQVFKDSASRLAQPTKAFYPPAPFQFILENNSLETPLGSNYTVHLKTDGEKLPQQVNLMIGGESFVMQANGKNQFSYTLYNVKEAIGFYFNAAGFRSDDFKLQILERPQLSKISLKLIYPSYTGIQNEEIEGFSNISVPLGTQMQWQLNTRNTENVQSSFNHQNAFQLPTSGDNNSWELKLTALKDSTIYFYLSNKKLPNFDTLSYMIAVIPDNVPQITAQQDKDSISQRQILIAGTASDDYGLSKLLFSYTISDEDKKVVKEAAIPIQATNNAKNLNYYHYFDINDFDLSPGQKLSYHIEAWDNDAIHGPKKAVSEFFTYQTQSQQELDKSIKENNEAINQQISGSHKETQNINQEIEKLRQQMLQSSDFSWEQENQLKSLTEKQKDIQDKLSALKKRFEMQQRQSEEKNYSDNVKEKQKELEKQLDKIQNKDLEDLMKKLQEMMSKKNKENTFQQLEQWQEENKLFQMDMERIQELMKQLALQMKLEDMAQKAKDLAKEQNQLAEKTKDQKEPNEAIKQQQKDLEKELNKLMKEDFADLKKQNNESQSPQDVSKAEESGKKAQQEMQSSQEKLSKDDNKEAEKDQKDAAENLQQMAAELSQMAEGMDMNMVKMNIKAVRQLLTNLLRYSFEQEELLLSEKNNPANVAVFEQHVKTQNILKQNAEMIKDSLFSLSKKVFQLAPTINKETTQLTKHLDNSILFLEDRRIREARISQQYAMTNANNLALLLEESLSNLMQMQMQMNADGQSGGEGSTPGPPGQDGKGKSPGEMMEDIITGQQAMGKGLSEMQGEEGGEGGQSGDGEQSSDGSGQGGSGSGNEQQKESGGNSQQQAERLARLAQQQAEIRNMMQELNSMLNSQGSGQNAELIQEIQKAMNQTEIDLVNRRLNSQLIKRQQDIMTRLLQAQDAIRNQEYDNKRVAESGKNLQAPMPSELKKILEERKAFLESYQTLPPNLKPFYQKLVEDYQREISGK